MAHAAMAAGCPGFVHFFENILDVKFRKVLKDGKFDTTLKWASTLEATVRMPAAALKLQEMVRAFAATDKAAGGWLWQAEELYALACDLAPSAHRRVGLIHGLALSDDLETHRRTGQVPKEKEDLRKLEAAAFLNLPIAWRGKVYRRTETADSAHKREEDEKKERARWARELAGLLLEANLPFARALGGAPLDGASLRCCRGLRARRDGGALPRLRLLPEAQPLQEVPEGAGWRGFLHRLEVGLDFWVDGGLS